MTLLCSVQSHNNDEPMMGTATGPVENWICIELPGAWPARFKANSLDLPLPLVRLARLASLPAHKLILIRRRKKTPEGFHVFIGQPKRNRVLKWVVDPNSEILDWEARLASEDAPKVEHPLILVCTHGSRDRCCGTLGGATFAALHKIKPDWVWQASHLGGHRFAPTLLSLPSGILYGRLGPEHAPDFLSALANDKPYDTRYIRGNTQYPPAVQAALLIQGTATADSYSIDTQDDGSSIVGIGVEGDRQMFHAQRVDTGRMACASCVDVVPKPIYAWRVRSYSPIP